MPKSVIIKHYTTSEIYHWECMTLCYEMVNFSKCPLCNVEVTGISTCPLYLSKCPPSTIPARKLIPYHTEVLIFPQKLRV